MDDKVQLKIMNTYFPFIMGKANRGKPSMVFDWHKAARLIKERSPKIVKAGLRGDWEYTGGTIFQDGKINKEDYTYLSSAWAKPEIELDDDVEECWIYQTDSPDWDSHTKWPDSAIEILKK
jgi:hypothetical protein